MTPYTRIVKSRLIATPRFHKINIIITYFILSTISCAPYQRTPEKAAWGNTDFTGFVSRDFFQVVVTVPPSPALSETEKRKQCKKKSVRERDRIAAIALEEAISGNKKEQAQTPALSDEINNNSQQNDSQDSEKKQSETEILVSKYRWFLNGLYLHLEEYQNGECKFIYRRVEKGLYSKLSEKR